MKLIGLAGKKQVGKSTAAGFLIRRGYVQHSFAGVMKNLVELLLLDVGVDVERIKLYRHDKEAVIPEIGRSMRHVLQTLGTDWGRNLIDEDLWIKVAARRIEMTLSAGRCVVIEDVRFENEADYICEQGGTVVHIVRDTGFGDEHASESGISVHPGDIVIQNDGSMDNYIAQLGLALGMNPNE